MSLDSHRKENRPPPRPPLTGLRWEPFLSATDAAGSAFGRLWPKLCTCTS
jgi:hypothetical protein